VDNILKAILTIFFKFFSRISPGLTAEVAWSFFCKPRIRKKQLSKFENNLLKQAKQYYIESENYRIAVYEWRNADLTQNSNTILLTHGWGGHALNYSHIITKLVEGGFNVIAYDSPAHGKSSGSKTNLLHNTHALLNVCAQIPPVTALVGHSFGAMASAYALELSNSSAILAHTNKIILIAGPNKLADLFASFTQAMGLPDVVLKIFHRKLETIAKRTIESMTTVDFLCHYRGKILVVHDHNDRIVPFIEAEKIANKLTSAALFATSAYGHSRILAAESVINTIFGFISETNQYK
jgi:pimeloyl-ACP methyl ester carboxylesterase